MTKNKLIIWGYWVEIILALTIWFLIWFYNLEQPIREGLVSSPNLFGSGLFGALVCTLGIIWFLMNQINGEFGSYLHHTKNETLFTTGFKFQCMLIFITSLLCYSVNLFKEQYFLNLIIFAIIFSTVNLCTCIMNAFDIFKLKRKFEYEMKKIESSK